MNQAERPHGSLSRYKGGPDEHGTEGKGCHCTPCRAANRVWKAKHARLAAYGLWQPYEDTAGTRRRIQALIWNGQSMAALARRLGCQRREIRELLFTRRHVTPQTAEKIRALYRELWDQPPPEETPREKQSAAKARKYARERSWCPPAAWDDDEIDDPAAVPAPGWDAEPRPAAQPLTGSPLVAAGIRRARQRAGMSQRALAEAVGVTPACVQLYEYGKRTPSAKTWIQLELTLGPLGVVRDAGPEPAAREQSDAA